MKTYDVVALGELLIDFTENGFSEQNNGMFEANPGGAPCNVLAMLRKFGKKTAFIGKVGQDMFGSLLKHTLEELEIDTSGLCIDEAVNTTLAFVHTAKNGDRDFSFYRNPGADMMLSESDLNRKLLTDCKLFHFGTLSMTNEVCRNATKTAVETAKNAGALISFDPNIRETLWDDMEDAKIQTAYGMSQCDILKISDNEIKWFTSIQDYDKAAKYLYDKYNIPLILVSLGPDGSMAFYDNQCIYMPACHMRIPLKLPVQEIHLWDVYSTMYWITAWYCQVDRYMRCFRLQMQRLHLLQQERVLYALCRRWKTFAEL